MKYVCTICGYVYDDAEHDDPFAELPASWVCPLCGAPKALFVPMTEEATPKKSVSLSDPVSRELKPEGDDDILTMLTPGELSSLFSSLAKGCEKQYQAEAKRCFDEIADYFGKGIGLESSGDLKRLANLIIDDLDRRYAALTAAAKAAGDRGTLRTAVWGEKVTRMAGSLIDRYRKQGNLFSENTGFYICTVCGFLYFGDRAPDICPVCKVPGWKFEKIGGKLR